MKISESWLRELVDVSVTSEELAEQLTMAGLEVEAVDSCKPAFTEIVIAKVVKIKPLGNSDNRYICNVDDGSSEMKTVICGAPNIAADYLYPYARQGAVLADGTVIKTRKINDIESNGMLCSAQELGLSETASELYEITDDTVPGVPMQDYLSLNDNVFDISLTPNRGDCLSMHGLAREVSVLNEAKINFEKVSKVKDKINDKLSISLEAPHACPRYCGRIIRNINANAITPVEIKERLRRSGLRCINIIVDLTNYVMLEMGQPMHAFDLGKLKGEISVRTAKPGEKLRLLDGIEYALSENTLVISDDSGAVAMAGIMGGEATAVSTDSSEIFLESAFFQPMAVMGRARQYGLHTDASHRFERGVDPTLADTALERLSALIINYCGGVPGPLVDAISQELLPQGEAITLRKARISKLLGTDIADEVVKNILTRLGFNLVADSTGWKVSIPAFRFDIEQEADLVEEVARIYGYGQIQGNLPNIKMNLSKNTDPQLRQQWLVNAMTSRGYTEVLTYSFVDPWLQAMLTDEEEELPLLNPISTDLAVMRKRLLPGLLSVLQYNIKRQQSRLRIFEIGRVFRKAGKEIEETPLLSGLSYGNIYEKQWNMDLLSSSFYTLKADVESVLGEFLDITDLSYEKGDNKALHPYQNAKIRFNDSEIGCLGMVNPEIQQTLEVAQPIFVFEVNLSTIPLKKRKNYEKISRFPAIRRDISVIIDEEIPAIEVINCIKGVKSELLHNLELFDVYQGEGIDLGKKSLALGLTFRRSSSTLTDEEADVVVNNVLISLENQFGAILRE